MSFSVLTFRLLAFRFEWCLGLWLAALVALLAGCASPPVSAPVPAPAPAPVAAPEPAPVMVLPPAPVAPPPAPVVIEPALRAVSTATTPRAYRQYGAKHLYGLNSERVYRGRMPPMLYAVAVLNVELDPQGHVIGLDWMRAPRHAPEVMREIERTIRQASPFPAPVRMGRVVYTDTWLWHSSGKFQLDTLTEGQD
jgi:hypothetical protein